jgi:SAM-dependent methyltransferase
MMPPSEPTRPNFPPDAFAGTAEFYLRYRVAYPAELLLDLAGRAGSKGEGRLLDLACGPGRVVLAMARWFREAWAVDLEPEMVEVGRREAARRGVSNVRWSVGRAEELEAPEASFRLVTIGEAFHRLDQPRIARQALRWLRPGGAIATLGSHGILMGQEPWQRLVADFVQAWVRAPSAGPLPASGPEHCEAVLSAAGFSGVASHPFTFPYCWTVDSILGYLYSTSVCSRRILGERAGAFESGLASALLGHDPGGQYRENMRFGYTFGRKPDR